MLRELPGELQPIVVGVPAHVVAIQLGPEVRGGALNYALAHDMKAKHAISLAVQASSARPAMQLLVDAVLGAPATSRRHCRG